MTKQKRRTHLQSMTNLELMKPFLKLNLLINLTDILQCSGIEYIRIINIFVAFN